MSCSSGRWTLAEHIDVRGWLVAEVEARPQGFGGPDGGHLFLFRTATDWSLIEVSHHTKWDADSGLPVDGRAYVRSVTLNSLVELRAEMERGYSSSAWRELVRAGAENDAELRALWVPVRIDLALQESSVYRREYGVH